VERCSSGYSAQSLVSKLNWVMYVVHLDCRIGVENIPCRLASGFGSCSMVEVVRPLAVSEKGNLIRRLMHFDCWIVRTVDRRHFQRSCPQIARN